MLALLHALGIADPALQGPALGGLFSFLGVLITGGIAILTWAGNKVAERRERDRIRQERRRDLRAAFFSEIDCVWRQWVVAGTLDDMLALAEAQFAKANAEVGEYKPFVTPETGTTLFAVFAGDLPFLDPEEISAIVAFYRQVRVIETFADRLKGAEFAEISKQRQKNLLLHYLRMIDLARREAERSLEALEARLDPPQTLSLPERRQLLLNRTASGHTRPAPEAPASPALGAGSAETGKSNEATGLS